MRTWGAGGRWIDRPRRVAWVGVVALLLLALGGCRMMPRGAAPQRFQFHLEASSATRPDHQFVAVLPVSGARIAVSRLPVLDQGDVLQVDEAEVAMGPCLRLLLRPMAARALYQISVEHRGQRLVLMIDGEPRGVRVLDDVLADGVLFTFVEVPDAQLPEIVEGMRAALR